MDYEYTDKCVTPWGGMLQMKRMLDKTGIEEFLSELGLPQGRSNNHINAVSIVEAFWVSVWIGAFRFSHTTVVRVDETLKKIFGWKRVPSPVTFTRFFRKFSLKENTRIFTRLNEWFFNQLHFDNYVLDVDSSVLTRYGEQEGSRVGYNPQKRGRPSHHPLFAFIADLRMVANCWLRSGDTRSANNCIAFLEETFQILKGKTIGLFRADAGFCSEKIFSFLESQERPVPYVIAGRMNTLLKWQIKDLRQWIEVDEGLWIGEMSYQAHGWSKERRMVVVKQDVGIRPKAGGKMLKLFDDSPFYERYRYHCFFTNQTLPAVEIWEQYKRRADSENRIQELKQDFGVEGFCMKNFYATEAALRMVMVAYNLVALYRLFSKQNTNYQRLTTLRFNCFAVGSWLIKRGHKKILKMSVPLKRRQWFDGLFANIKRSEWPLSLQT
ncbi:MAG: IS1380 family transposase [Cytophagaceae bacterium]|nr:IS1380 family transposase [Cytophagaceae bacterium]MDW8457439.1 IS1380 family transposase [Cytophagaceae bacterium]